MKYLLLIIYLLFHITFVNAQNKNNGEYYNKSTGEIGSFLFDRILTEENKFYKTNYKIYNIKNVQIYNINIENSMQNRIAIVNISNTISGVQKTYLIKYDQNSGLIGDTITFKLDDYNAYSVNDIICSFQDTNRTYLYINKFKDFDQPIYYEVQKISNFLLNKHKTMLLIYNNIKVINENKIIESNILQSNNDKNIAKAIAEKDNEINTLLDSLKILQEIYNNSNEIKSVEYNTITEMDISNNKILNEKNINPYDGKYLSPTNSISIKNNLIKSILNNLYNLPCTEYEKKITFYISINKEGKIESIKSDQIDESDLYVDYYLSNIIINLKKDSFDINYLEFKGEQYATKYNIKIDLEINIKTSMIKTFYDGDNFRVYNTQELISKNLNSQINKRDEFASNKKYIISYCNYSVNESIRQKLDSINY